MNNNRPLCVFLCHSSADKPAVRKLYQKLRAEPWIEPWLDEEELFPSMDWNLETDTILVPSNNSSTRRKKRSVNVSHLLKRTWRYMSIWSPFVNL